MDLCSLLLSMTFVLLVLLSFMHISFIWDTTQFLHTFRSPIVLCEIYPYFFVKILYSMFGIVFFLLYIMTRNSYVIHSFFFLSLFSFGMFSFDDVSKDSASRFNYQYIPPIFFSHFPHIFFLQVQVVHESVVLQFWCCVKLLSFRTFILCFHIRGT